jgi:hypothetical protein
MTRGRFLSLVALAPLCAVGSAWAQGGSADPAFADIPLHDWLRGGERSALRWSEHIAPARLGSQQRLLLQMTIQLDGQEIADRPGKGRLLMLVQITDPQGGVWQDHGAPDFRKVEEGVRSQYLTWTWSAFVLPGDYRVALAVVDTQNHDHGAREERVHVEALRNDPLPDAWRGLPAVELLAPDQPPAFWYQPDIRDRLHLPLATRRPVLVDVLVNLTPSERASGSPGAQNNNLRVLLPALKVLSQMDPPSGSMNVSLLDLTRQKVTLQHDLHSLDWPMLRDALGAQETGTIDVGSLEERSRSAAFFISEVRRRIAAHEGEAHALVILSSAVEFEKGEDLKPIDAAPSSDLRVFYFRYPAFQERPARSERVMHGYGRHGGGGMPGEWRRPGYQGRELQIDQLEPTLKPLAPRLHDIESPEQFRKALAGMMDEISRM